MKIMAYLQRIYESVYNCRLRLLKALDEKGVHAVGNSNVLSEWGLISIINGYFISELNTMTIRQIMHLRKKPGSVIYNADYNTLNRCVTLMKSLNPRYQETKLYKANIIRNTGMYGWMNSGDIRWFHNMGVYVGPDNMPVVTLNGGATWDMIDLSELYSSVGDIVKIKATIASEFEIIFFTLITRTRVSIYALSSKSFGQLDYAWLIQADLDMFTKFTLVPVSNSDQAELVALNGGTTLIFDLYGMNEGDTVPVLHHYVANVNEYGTILVWKETKGYFDSIAEFGGRFVISKDYMSTYGLASVRSTYAEFILTDDEKFHLVITSGTSETVPITHTFTYNTRSYGQLTTEAGSSTNVNWIRCSMGLLVIQNNRTISMFPYLNSFTLLDATSGIGVDSRDGYAYFYLNGAISKLTLNTLINGNILKVRNFAGKRSAIFLHNAKGEFVVDFDDANVFKTTALRWFNGGVKDPAMYNKVSSNAIFSRTRIASNGRGTCVRYYENNVPVTGYTVSYDSGATWHLVRTAYAYIAAFYFNKTWYLVSRNGVIFYSSNPEKITTEGCRLIDLEKEYTRLYTIGYTAMQIPVLLPFVYGVEVRLNFAFISRKVGDQLVLYPETDALTRYDIPYASLQDNTKKIALCDDTRSEYKWTNAQEVISFEANADTREYTIYIDDVLTDTISYTEHQIAGIYQNPEGYALMDRGLNVEDISAYNMTAFLPLTLELKSAVVYRKEDQIRFETMCCNDMVSNIGNFTDSSKSMSKTSDMEVYLSGDYVGGVLSSSNVDQFHQGIAEYIDIKTGKRMHYHGRIQDIQSTAYMDNMLTGGQLKDIFSIGNILYGIYYNELDGYFLTSFIKEYGFAVFSECLFHPFKYFEVTKRDYLIRNQWMYYLSEDGIVKQSLSMTMGIPAAGTILAEGSSYSYLRELAGFILAIKTGSQPSIMVLQNDTTVYAMDTVNEVEDVGEWDDGLFAIINVVIGGIEKCFLISFENANEFFSSTYINERQIVYPDQIDGEIYELNLANEEDSLTAYGVTDNQMVSCDAYLLIWNPHSNVIYRYDGVLFTYWKNTLTGTIADVQYQNGIVYVRDTDMNVYYSYDGKIYNRYYLSNVSKDLQIANIYGNLIIVDNTNMKLLYNGMMTDSGFTKEQSYGFYTVSDVDPSKGAKLTIPNGQIESSFGILADGVVVDNIQYQSGTEVVYLDLAMKNLQYDDSTLENGTYLFVNTFAIT